MRPHVALRSVVALGLVLALVGFVLTRVGDTQEKNAEKSSFSLPKFLLVTRHCEKDPKGDARDAGLSEDGRKRAAALAKLVGPAGIRHVFTSEYKRARETGAAVKGKDVQEHVLPGADSAALFKALDELPWGETALVVGHSNTVPAVLAHFGLKGGSFEAMAEDDFGSLFVVTIPERNSGVGASVLRLHYGD